MKQQMKIYVDADACPVVQQVENAAKQHNLPVMLLCDTNHVLNSACSEVRVIGAGADAVDLALINTNYALDAKLNPVRDALAIEDGKSPYVNFVVGKPGSEKDPRVQKLVAALKSDDVKHFMAEHYKGAVLPAF